MEKVEIYAVDTESGDMYAAIAIPEVVINGKNTRVDVVTHGITRMIKDMLDFGTLSKTIEIRCGQSSDPNKGLTFDNNGEVTSKNYIKNIEFTGGEFYLEVTGESGEEENHYPTEQMSLVFVCAVINDFIKRGFFNKRSGFNIKIGLE